MRVQPIANPGFGTHKRRESVTLKTCFREGRPALGRRGGSLSPQRRAERQGGEDSSNGLSENSPTELRNTLLTARRLTKYILYTYRVLIDRACDIDALNKAYRRYTNHA